MVNLSHIGWKSLLRKSIWGSIFLGTSWTHSLSAIVVTVNVSPGDVLNWVDYSLLGPGDTLNLVLSDPSGEVELQAIYNIDIRDTITCNGKLKIASQQGSITHEGTITASQVILQAPKIMIDPTGLIDTSSTAGGGDIFIGGGWLGLDPSIINAKTVAAFYGSQLIADGQVNSSGGTVVLWAEKFTGFEGTISAQGTGLAGDGGNVEISSGQFLFYDGIIDVSAQNGNTGTIAFDPVSITIQTANPDINGNGGNLDMTMVNQLDNATTTPTGFPNADSIITAAALGALLTNNVSLTLAAQETITVNAPVTAAGTNTTLTLSAPTVNLNQPISLPGGGTLVGSGVATVNVGTSGSIQNGADVANNGATVTLGAATYLGPLYVLNKNITVTGAGSGSTTILNPPGGVPTQSGRNPIVFIQGGTGVTIENLTVDGNYVGFPINGNITGIFALNGGGTIQNIHVTKIANTAPPYVGGQQGIGIIANGSSGGPYTLNIANNTIDLFQKGGIVTNGSHLTVNITNNQVIGLGVPSTPAANGIQISSGASGTVSGNTVSGIEFSDHASSTGILIFGAGANLIVTGNTVDSNDEGIISIDAGDGLTITQNTVENSGDTGIAILDTSGNTQITQNIVTNNGGPAGGAGINTGIYLFSSLLQTFEISQNTITPAPGFSGVFTQGNAFGLAPDVSLFSNTFLDP